VPSADRETVAEQANDIILKVVLHAVRGGVKYHVPTTVRHTILVVVTTKEVIATMPTIVGSNTKSGAPEVRCI
jgi:hypothetical protein